MTARPIKVGVTTCYLLTADDGYVLVDTGYDRNWAALKAGLGTARVSLADVHYLILTHHHDDHSGLLNRAVATNPQIRVVMSQHAKGLLRGGRNDWSSGGGYINRRAKAFTQLLGAVGRWTQSFPPYEVRPEDVLVAEDAELRTLGLQLDGRIVNTPGHSIDSISVALPNGDWLVGDAASNLPGFFGTRHCVIALEDLDLYYRTWADILQAGAKRIMPAHGSPFPADQLKRDLGRMTTGGMVRF